VEYYIAADQQRLGPFTIEQLAQQGLRPDTLAWREGMPQWLPASLIPELLPILTATPAPIQNPTPQQSIGYATPGDVVIPAFVPGNSNRITAGILGIFLGQFGVHKFVMGLNSGAVVMLCISLAGYVLGFGCCILIAFGPLVMAIFGLIEGIMYLCCTDEEFYMRYVVQKRQWF